MPEITPEQREKALKAMRTVACWGSWDEASRILDALLALGWGPAADAEDRGYRAGIEAGAVAGWDASRKLAIAGCAIIETKAAEALTCALPVHVEGFHRGEQTTARSIAKGLAAIEAEEDSHFQAVIRALTDKPKETPHGH